MLLVFYVGVRWGAVVPSWNILDCGFAAWCDCAFRMYDAGLRLCRRDV